MSNQFTKAVRKPEYTGANRCVPCTAVNVVLAAALSGACYAAGQRLGAGEGTTVGASGLVFVASAVLIYARGYLVPGTPTLTKRYFPVWLLQLFGKERERIEAADVDPETVLEDREFLVEREDGDDLQLADGFRAAFDDQFSALDDDVDRPELLSVLDVDEHAVEFDDHDGGFGLRVDGTLGGVWESDLAVRIDVATARLLAERGVWSALGTFDRVHVLREVRSRLETCPACGGRLTIEGEMVDTCCYTEFVPVLSCESCYERVLEFTEEATPARERPEGER